MISRLNHVNVFVLDQDRAKDFYTETLGFELRNDAVLDGFRWLGRGFSFKACRHASAGWDMASAPNSAWRSTS